MQGYQYAIILISLSAALAYINQRWIKMPFVIALFFLSTLLSILFIATKSIYAEPYEEIRELVQKTDLSQFILDILLGFLLFAGSLHTNWQKMRLQFKKISILAISGVLMSTILIAVMLYYGTQFMHIPLPFIYCLIFGALISPTDPIAVLGILKKANVPEKVETTIIGESLFNDGIGVVLFIALSQMLSEGITDFDLKEFSFLFLQEAGGGVVFGLIAGYILHALLKSIDHYSTEILLTIAFVMLGYSTCSYFHISGALAMVVMGLMVGNFKIEESMSDITQEYVNKFWELLDVLLNAVLFMLIAFVIVVVDLNEKYFLLGFLSIIIILLSRAMVVFLHRKILPKSMNFNHKEAEIIVWGGLRGGLSLALVLSLPSSEYRDILLVATYTVVVFSIVIQGLTIESFVKKIYKTNATKN